MTWFNRYAAGLGLATLLLTACETPADPSGPSGISAAKGGRWAARELTSLVETTTDAGTGGAEAAPAVLGFLPGSPPLRTYDTTFSAHQGWQQQFVIFHEDGNYFMVLDVPNSAQFVSADGTPLADGERFGLRARVSETSVSFEFEPHGSYFTGARPVMLWVYLRYLDQGSGGALPSIWYQADDTEPWTALTTTADKAGKWLKVELRHFSNYAVAW